MDQFFTLTPDRILDSVERALGSSHTGVRATGRCIALNSMENRVYEIELDGKLELVDDDRVITKFYRPGRWTKECILEEHAFLAELTANEVPAVAPLTLDNGSTLDQSEDGILFAAFPKVRGQILQELSDSQLEQVGRLLARMHNVGASSPAKHRLALNAQTYGRHSLEFLETKNMIDIQILSSYRRTVEGILDAVEPMLAGVPTHRLHGDCHLGNVLWQSTGPFFVDFDDMVTGPAVQDLWLVVRGRDDEAVRQRQVFLSGYETMRAFDRRSLKLIEALRALRMIHYSAWIARRWDDPTFKNAFPDFGSYKYWQEQLQDLNEQHRLILDARSIGEA